MLGVGTRDGGGPRVLGAAMCIWGVKLWPWPPHTPQPGAPPSSVTAELLGTTVLWRFYFLSLSYMIICVFSKKYKEKRQLF